MIDVFWAHFCECLDSILFNEVECDANCIIERVIPEYLESVKYAWAVRAVIEIVY